MSDVSATHRPDPLDGELIGALLAHRGHVGRAAQSLGVSRATAYRRLQRADFRDRYERARERYLQETVNELARRRADRLVEAVAVVEIAAADLPPARQGNQVQPGARPRPGAGGRHG
jgi:hypothetical protein